MKYFILIFVLATTVLVGVRMISFERSKASPAPTFKPTEPPVAVARPETTVEVHAEIPARETNEPASTPVEAVSTQAMNQLPSQIVVLAPAKVAALESPIPVKKVKHQGNNGAPKPPKVLTPFEQSARAALGYVGMDKEAEQYWQSAINDPSLPPDSRKDLIEDLNEDGLSDPKNPTAADLPVIQNRLDMIEQIAPAAIDDVNAAAFAEAYKDLIAMEQRLTGR